MSKKAVYMPELENTDLLCINWAFSESQQEYQRAGSQITRTKIIIMKTLEKLGEVSKCDTEMLSEQTLGK